jgi:hypothetical protein
MIREMLAFSHLCTPRQKEVPLLLYACGESASWAAVHGTDVRC